MTCFPRGALAVAAQVRHRAGMTIMRRFRDVIAPAVDLVYPPRCPVCGEGLGEQSGLCLDCWNSLRIPGAPSCAQCQRPLDSLIGGNLSEALQCAPCMAKAPRHDGIAAATLYNDTSRALVLAFKHGRRIALAPMLGRMMAARLPDLDGDWLIMPVPLHRWRLWQRGFNQAGLLAREIARITGHQLMVDGLERKRRTKPLGGMGRKERQRMLAGAIRVSPSKMASIKGQNVVLVDDVLTSGATSNACVDALKRVGAKRVLVCCFARVIDEV